MKLENVENNKTGDVNQDCVDSKAREMAEANPWKSSDRGNSWHIMRIDHAIEASHVPLKGASHGPALFRKVFPLGESAVKQREKHRGNQLHCVQSSTKSDSSQKGSSSSLSGCVLTLQARC